jgi:ABC-type sugar transport system ATPase subunit
MSEQILTMTNITKDFGGIRALNNVNLDLYRGEILCLLGENGAGKSTLIKILSGVEQPTSGEIFLNGEKVHLKNPRVAHEMGFSTVYQELVQLPEMSIAENIFIGRYPLKAGLIDYNELNKMTLKLMDRLNIHFNPQTKIGSLSIAQRQLVEIIKALSFDSQILIFDEPTSSLTTEETAILFDTILKLKERNISVIYISHRLEDVFEVGDRVVVLRDGENSGSGLVENLDHDAIISMMVGRMLGDRFPKRKVEIGEDILAVKNINNERVKNASFSLRRGEILGFSGLVGAGRSDLMNAIMGIDKCSGEIFLEGEKIQNESPTKAISRGFAAVPEDRKDKGLILILSVMHNMQLSAFKRFVNKFGFLIRKNEQEVADEYINKLAIKVSSYRQDAGDLSGGNQQKVVFARGLISNPKVLILDEPTRGIDVGAKAEIYEIMNSLVEQGVSIIMVSSELPELLNMSDRIIVMHEGFIVGELDPAEATEEMVIKMATQEMNHKMSAKEAVI